MRARAVIACVDSDADNIFIALTARGLRPDILIIARASAEDAEKKLQRAGADRVISPYKTSGSEMARLALHPQVGGAAQGRRLPDGRDRGLRVVRRAWARRSSRSAATRWSWPCATPTGGWSPSRRRRSVIEAGQLLVAIGTPDGARAARDGVPAASRCTAHEPRPLRGAALGGHPGRRQPGQQRRGGGRR